MMKQKHLYVTPLCFCVFIDFQNMPGAMRPSGPRPQTFGAMRPASQVPRMMSAQRVGQSPILDQ